MNTDICIVLLVVMILCFALLLAWLAAKPETISSVRLTVRPEEGAVNSIRLETPNGALLLTLEDCRVADLSSVSHPVPVGDEDPE